MKKLYIIALIAASYTNIYTLSTSLHTSKFTIGTACGKDGCTHGDQQTKEKEQTKEKQD